MNCRTDRTLRHERKEIATLQRRGFSFTVKGREKRRFPLSFMEKEVEYKFTVAEPVMGCLIAEAEDFVEIDIDSRLLDAEDAVAECNAIIARHAERCCRILATAVLNDRCRNVPEVRRLTGLFLRTLTPSQLRMLLQRVAVLGDLESFTDAIRLISKSRVTMPERIAEDMRALSPYGGE